MGQSASGIACDLSGGKFGPFEDQLFVGDQMASTVMRVFLEKVNGRYQGACFPFREGFDSGNLSLQFAGDGSLFVYGTDRGWTRAGGKPYALQRLVWTGKDAVRGQGDAGGAGWVRPGLHGAGRCLYRRPIRPRTRSRLTPTFTRAPTAARRWTTRRRSSNP
jgi:hypothetical protein